MDNKSHIFKYLHSTATCSDLYNSLSFKIIHKVNSKLDLKSKAALHITWRKPNLIAQENYLALTLLLELLPPLVLFLSLFLFYFSASLSSIIFFISDTNYRSLLLPPSL